MPDLRQEAGYDFKYVAARLGEAGMTLLALHVPGTRPAGLRSFWPDIPGALIEPQAAPPPARRITRMDEALNWIALIPEDKLVLRKLVGARALTSPRTEKPIFSWAMLGRQIGCTDVSAKTWWINGVEIIVRRLNQPGLCQDPAVRGTRAASAAALRQASVKLTRTLRKAEFV